jgi:hypothetical protein
MIYACLNSVRVTKTCTPRSFCSEHNSIPCYCVFIVFCFRQTPRLSSQVFLSFAILKSALNSFRCCIELCVCPCRKLQQSCTSCFYVTMYHLRSHTHTSGILKVYKQEQNFVYTTSHFNHFPVNSALRLYFCRFSLYFVLIISTP